MWTLQKKYMDTGTGLDWLFVSYMCAEDGSSEPMRQAMAGQMLSVSRWKQIKREAAKEWWDTSDEAGPATRPRVEFESPCPELKALAFDSGSGKLTTLG